MNLTDAVSLIYAREIDAVNKSAWADLGCGDGLFSNAIASLLAPDSIVFAVDIKPVMPGLATEKPVRISTVKKDFASDELQLPLLDGIIMANSLHFVSSQDKCIKRLAEFLKPNGVFIIVEYDLSMPNRWVPYPLPAATLPSLFRPAGFANVREINRLPSVYQRADIYGCIICR